MRWVLIRPLNHSPYYDPEIQEPLGPEYLAASLQSRGDNVLILDAVLDGHDDIRLAKRAVSFEPDVIGFSITTGQELASVKAIHVESTNRMERRDVRWLAGGNFVSTELQSARKLLPSEFTLIRYEGEQVLNDLSDMWISQASHSATDIYDGAQVEELDSLPFPTRPFADSILGNGWAFNLQGSRGCCGTCRYCASPGMASESRNSWRGRSPFSIVEEIEQLNKRFGAYSFNFIDEDFLGPDNRSTERATAFADEIRRRKLDISFGIQVRPGTLNERVIRALATAGLIYVFMGLESDDPEDFRRWRRPYSPDSFARVALLRSHGVEINAGVMLFHSHSSLEGIRRFATSLRNNGLLEYRSAINRLDAMPGSFFFNEALKSGEIDQAQSGPQPLRYLDPRIADFRHDLILALEPLGPPSMHAICSLPPLLARARLDARFKESLSKLREILWRFDEVVSHTFFTVLVKHEMTSIENGYVSSLRESNLVKAIEGCEALVAMGFAPSFEMLRDAIRNDSGM